MINEETAVYKLNRMGKTQYLTFKKFDKFPELSHLFTTRQGGVSSGYCTSWNFGAHDLDTAENIHRNFEIMTCFFSIEDRRGKEGLWRRQ